MGINIESELQELKMRLEELSLEASESAKDAGGRAQQYAQENPWQMAVAAAAIGFLAATVVSAARHRND